MKTMERAKHTPGPWKVGMGSAYGVIHAQKRPIVNGDGWAIQEDNGRSDEWAEENEANARLIAEAGTVASETGLTPRQLADQRKELLGALLKINETACLTELLGESPEDNGGCSCASCFAEKAIAKAEGHSL